MPSIANAYRGCRTPPSHAAIVSSPQASDIIARPTDGKRLKLYFWLFELARAGEPCPSNDGICERFGFASWASGARLMATLEKTGLIEVERKSASRRVFVRELQRWTA